MSWNCRCELCRHAFEQKLEARRWTDFLRHRENVVIRADIGDGLPVYLTEYKGEIVVATTHTENPKPIRDTWNEEVVLIDFLRECDVEPVENEVTPFDELVRKKAVA